MGAWDLTGLPDGHYTVRLEATTTSYVTYEDRAEVYVDNVALANTVGNALWHDGTAIDVVGTVAPPALKNYAISVWSYTMGSNVSAPHVVLVNGGTVAVTNGKLATWDPVALPAGYYRVDLTTTLQNGMSSVESMDVVVDPLLKPGWPASAGSSDWRSALGKFGHFAAADVDGDGKLEIPVATGSTVTLYHHDGQVVAGWPKTISDGFGALVQFAPAMGDLDGDGKADLVFGTQLGQMYAYHGDGTSLPGFPQYISNGGPTQFALADMNGDGRLDIVFTTDRDLRVIDGNGNPLPGWPVALPHDWTRPAVGDLDRDGHPEIVVRTTTNELHVFGVDGQERAGFPRTITDSGSILTTPVLADLDGDQSLEIIVASNNGTLHVLRNDGSYLSGWPKQMSSAWLNQPAAADLDGDGRPEIVVGTGASECFSGLCSQLFALRAEGTNMPGWPVMTSNARWQFFGYSAPAIADIDGDGTVEIVVSTDSTAQHGFSALMAYHADGTTVTGFPRPTPHVGMASDSGPAIADIDNDGRFELIWGDSSANIGVYNLAGPSTGKAPWPVAFHDAAHTSVCPVNSVPPSGHLKAEYRPSDPNATDNTIGPRLRLSDVGATPVPLPNVTVRYWFTNEGATSLRYTCDWVAMGCSNVTSKFVRLPTAVPGADTYLEIGFAEPAPTLAPGADTGEIQGRINKIDWSNFNEGDDYSFKAQTEYADSTKITVYVGGQLVWGIEPTASGS